MKNTAINPIPKSTVAMYLYFAAKIINTLITNNKYPKFILLISNIETNVTYH